MTQQPTKKHCKLHIDGLEKSHNHIEYAVTSAISTV